MFYCFKERHIGIIVFQNKIDSLPFTTFFPLEKGLDLCYDRQIREQVSHELKNNPGITN